MIKWIILVVLIVSGAILGYIYTQLSNTPTDTAALSQVEAPNTVHVIHSYKDGIHRFIGQIKLPHSCYSVKTDVLSDPKDPSVLVLSLTTKNNILDEKICANIQTRYPFEVIADAPEHIQTTMTIDGTEVPLRVTETQWQDSRGTVLNAGSGGTPE